MPLEMWEEMMKERNVRKKSKEIKKYRGIIKATKDMEKEIKKLRNEWEKT